jgi:hypothetical protein
MGQLIGNEWLSVNGTKGVLISGTNQDHPCVIVVAGIFGIAPAGVTEEQSEPLVDIIVLTTMISVKI